MKSNIILFLHDEKNKCYECLEVERLFERISTRLKKKGVLLNKIEDSSFEEIFRNEKLPILRIERMPPEHYSGLQEIHDYILQSKYINNSNQN